MLVAFNSPFYQVLKRKINKTLRLKSNIYDFRCQDKECTLHALDRFNKNNVHYLYTANSIGPTFNSKFNDDILSNILKTLETY